MFLTVCFAAAASALGATLFSVLLLRTIPKRWMGVLIGFAAGVLLAVALLGALPEALEKNAASTRIPAVMLIGLLAIFGLEAVLRGFAASPSLHADPALAAGLGSGVRERILLGGALHHFADGALLAASFAANPRLGWGVAIAVMAHEVPHKASDITVLREFGCSLSKASALAAVSALFAMPGAGLGALALGLAEQAIPYCLALAAASFLYITLSDLFPAMRRETNRRILVGQLVALALGIGMVSGLESLAH